MTRRPRIIDLVVSWGLVVASGCARPSGAPPGPAASSSSQLEPIAVVSKMLGKEHVPSSSPWASRAACQAALSTDEQRRSSTVGALRVGTWNIRYFPDGAASGTSELATDIEWLACAIAFLDVDVLAMQEIKSHARARAASHELIRQLHALTGREYAFEVAQCDDPNMHRPGVLYDSARITLTRRQTIGQFEVGSRCSDETSPVLSVRVQLEQRASLELLVVHAPPGRKPVELAARSAFWDKLASWLSGAGSTSKATDLMLLGDLNTWGCDGCREPLDSAHELRRLADVLRSSGLTSMPASEPCSFMLGKDAPLLDGFFVSSRLREQGGNRAIVSGYCASTHCRDTFPEARSERALSDHCPLLLELAPAPG